MTAKTKAAAAKTEPEEQPAEAPVAEAVLAEESMPQSHELVVRPDVPEDVWRAMDAADEAQILDALMGKPSEKLVYKFSSGGKQQTGLSYEGVAEVVREMNATPHARIRVSPDFVPIISEVTEENEHGEAITYVQALVYAEDTHNGGGNFGTARQAKFQVFTDKGKKPRLDPFAVAKALSKSQRNAMKPLTPVVWREALIAKHLSNPARVKELRVGMGDPVAELPPPLTDDRAATLKADIRGVYKEIREIDPMALPPGRFNVQFRRTEHEHEAMEEFLEGLRSQLAHLRGESS